MKYSANELNALRRYQVQSGSKEQNLERAMKEYRAAREIYKAIKPFSRDKQRRIVLCAGILSGALELPKEPR